jgi:O-antigen ligase
MDKKNKGVDIGIVLGVICIASFFVFWLLILDPISLWEKFIRSKIGSEIITFTGRGQIWSVAINAWLDNPAFGYGPEIWGTEYRAQIGMQFAFSAHNQFLQSLSAAGALGFACLMIYLWLLGRYAVQASNKTKGVAFALFLLTILRSMTETPLAINTLFNGEFLVHLLLFQIVIRGAPFDNQRSSSGIKLTGMRPHSTTLLANSRKFK